MYVVNSLPNSSFSTSFDTIDRIAMKDVPLKISINGAEKCKNKTVKNLRLKSRRKSHQNSLRNLKDRVFCCIHNKELMMLTGSDFVFSRYQLK